MEPDGGRHRNGSRGRVIAVDVAAAHATVGATVAPTAATAVTAANGRGWNVHDSVSKGDRPPLVWKRFAAATAAVAVTRGSQRPATIADRRRVETAVLGEAAVAAVVITAAATTVATAGVAVTAATATDVAVNVVIVTITITATAAATVTDAFVASVVGWCVSDEAGWHGAQHSTGRRLVGCDGQ